MDFSINLISVEDLSVKLGRTLDPDSPDYKRAEQNIWSVSVRAKSIAEKSDADWLSDVPALVQSIVLDASYRVFKNPSRYVQNQASQFMAAIDHNELAGNLFLSAEIDDLMQFRENPGMWTQPTYRDRPIYPSTSWAPVVGGSPFPM